MLVELLLSLCLPMIYSEHDTNSKHSPSSGTGNIAVHAGVEKGHLELKDSSTNSNYGASSDHTANLHKYFGIQSLEDTRLSSNIYTQQLNSLYWFQNPVFLWRQYSIWFFENLKDWTGYVNVLQKTTYLFFLKISIISAKCSLCGGSTPHLLITLYIQSSFAWG